MQTIRLRQTHKDEGGFSLVEATIAMALVALLVVGLSATILVAVRQQRDIRQRQQATAIALEQVEFARSLTWTQLELSSAPDTTIPHHAAGRIDGAFFEIGTNEALVIDPGVYTAEDPDPGLIDPGYFTTEVVNGVPFEVYQYVTEVEPGLRRFTVLVQWNEDTRTYVGMTQISTLGAG